VRPRTCRQHRPAHQAEEIQSRNSANSSHSFTPTPSSAGNRTRPPCSPVQVMCGASPWKSASNRNRLGEPPAHAAQLRQRETMSCSTVVTPTPAVPPAKPDTKASPGNARNLSPTPWAYLRGERLTPLQPQERSVLEPSQQHPRQAYVGTWLTNYTYYPASRRTPPENPRNPSLPLTRVSGRSPREIGRCWVPLTRSPVATERRLRRIILAQELPRLQAARVPAVRTGAA